jgi:hypothetical protein
MTTRSDLAAGAGVVVLIAALSGCIDYLDPGEVGAVRYFGEVRSTAGMPLPVLPPISDRDGNAYVLSGARDLRQVTAFTGQAGGGWSSGCSLHKADDRGAHGWIGGARDRAWYWSGDALVEVSGETGSCNYVLDRDPASAANLAFLGVVPSVRDAPSRVTVVALIQSPNDALPYWVVVDLGLQRYTQLRRFEPGNASNVVVLGTGALDDAGRGVMLVKYDLGGVPVVEARYLDADATETGVAKVGGLEMAAEDEVLGFLAATEDTTAAGVLADGRLVVFNRQGGSARGVSGLTPAGVHVKDGALWMVGTNGSGPAIAGVAPDGGVGGIVGWSTSSRAAGALAGGLQVVDDRAAPRRYTTWSNSSSAIGPFPFLSAATPHAYASGTTLWVIAGTAYDVGGELRTQIALAPIGLAYP